LPPSLDLARDFGSSNFTYEAYQDDRIPGAKDANRPAASPLHFFGMRIDSNVPIYQLYQGAAFFPVGETCPYVIQVTNFGLLTLHPSPQHLDPAPNGVREWHLEPMKWAFLALTNL
jgi:hypothetical protein